jgi:hypothetical protein
VFKTQKQAKVNGSGRQKRRRPYEEIQAANNLRDALMEVAPLKQCNRHPRRIWFQEKDCPVCQAEGQYFNLPKRRKSKNEIF